jgi:hypothetical protein
MIMSTDGVSGRRRSKATADTRTRSLNRGLTTTSVPFTLACEATSSFDDPAFS